jgi:hypothetical protein
MNAVARFGRWIGLAGALVLSLSAVSPAFAAGQVTQVIKCGGGGNSLNASIVDMTLDTKDFATVAQDSLGNLNLSAAETGCDAKGWKVTIQASTWAKDGGGTAIPANAFSLTQTNNPGYTSGQQIDNNNGPKLVNELGTLDQSRKVLNANAGYGVGSYTQVLGVKLVIPAVTLPGTYKTTITTTMTTAP